MIRSNSKQSGGIHVVKPEERKGKECQLSKFLKTPRNGEETL